MYASGECKSFQVTVNITILINLCQGNLSPFLDQIVCAKVKVGPT